MAGINRGRHVVAVLPEYLCTEDVTVTLADALVDAMDDAAHLSVGADRTLVEQVCSDVSDDLEERPVSIRELLTWAARRARAFVLNASEIASVRRPELLQFLERLSHESRLTADGGIHLVVIAKACDLPEALSPDGDVTVMTKWFWNRVARWDTVAHVAMVGGGVDVDSLVDEIRVETIVELARWDLAYATEVASLWTGASMPDLRSLVDGRSIPTDVFPSEGIAATKVGSWPPPRMVQGWNIGVIDGWRGRVSVAPTANGSAGTVDRHVWAAQARVLLPYIETKRARLEVHLRDELGAVRFEREVEKRAVERANENYVQAPVPEIALLREIARFARRDERRTKSLTVLRDSRNCLAHLVPLNQEAVVELERACLWLG